MCQRSGAQGGVHMRGGRTITNNQQANTEKTQQPTNSHCFGSNNAGACDGSPCWSWSMAGVWRGCSHSHGGFSIAEVQCQWCKSHPALLSVHEWSRKWKHQKTGFAISRTYMHALMCGYWMHSRWLLPILMSHLWSKCVASILIITVKMERWNVVLVWLAVILNRIQNSVEFHLEFETLPQSQCIKIIEPWISVMSCTFTLFYFADILKNSDELQIKNFSYQMKYI